ncbi:unnamed protein product [Schistosoma mattheei]|uniref:Band 7 domain-containing protein n=1 Tax=Schistosoma mattheei TaxID=31246 RepID=A0A3P8IUZ6_9TREM|nr:unnamed protein product [Schistosoma mattheei]
MPKGARGPGLFFIAPCIDSIRKVDLRTVTFDVPPQEVLTKDSVTVAVDAVVYYRIYNPVVAITNVEDADRSTRLLAATTLRNVLGTKNLAEILSERESISTSMQKKKGNFLFKKIERFDFNNERKNCLWFLSNGIQDSHSTLFGTRQLDVLASQSCSLWDSNPVSFASNTIALST